jgi:hypothetical protein
MDPTVRGFGFAVMEAPDWLIDWGLKHVRREKNHGSLRKVGDLIDRYEPDVVVLEDTGASRSRRSQRVRRLIEDVEALAGKRGIEVRKFSPTRVQKFFLPLGGITRHEIAEALARRFPELEPKLPRLRRLWMTEDLRLRIFGAAALAFLCLRTRHRRG